VKFLQPFPIGSAIVTTLASLAAAGLPWIGAVVGAVCAVALLVPHLFWQLYLPMQTLKSGDRAAKAQALLESAQAWAVAPPNKKKSPK
jgi:hypothetical protein